MADSAFASVDTAALLKHSLHFIGVVKTAHTKFPIKQSTEFMVTTIEVDGSKHTLLRTLASADWICRKQGKRLVAICSSGEPDGPQVIEYSKTVQKNGVFGDVEFEWQSDLRRFTKTCLSISRLLMFRSLSSRKPSARIALEKNTKVVASFVSNHSRSDFC